MGQGLLRKGLNAAATSGSQMIAAKIDDARQRRLAQFDSSLRKDEAKYGSDIRVSEHQQTAEYDKNAAKGRFEDINQNGLLTGQRDTWSGQVTPLNTYDTQKDAREDQQAHESELQASRLLTTEIIADADRASREKTSANSIEAEVGIAVEQIQSRERISQQEARWSLASNIVKQMSAERQKITEALQFEEDEEKRKQLTDQYNSTHERMNKVLEALKFGDLLKEPGVEKDTGDTEAPKGAPDADTAQPELSFTKVPDEVSTETPAPATTNPGGLLSGSRTSTVPPGSPFGFLSRLRTQPSRNRRVYGNQG